MTDEKPGTWSAEMVRHLEEAHDGKFVYPFKCLKCNCWGGRIVTFTQLSGSSITRWVCPHCMDRDEHDLTRLRKQEEGWKEMQESKRPKG